jgi:hypothetical protein
MMRHVSSFLFKRYGSGVVMTITLVVPLTVGRGAGEIFTNSMLISSAALE